MADFSDDGGPATSARLKSPYGVVVDASGNLFIADRENNRIQRVDKNTGIITTVAGNGHSGSSLDPLDGGPATSATLSYPSGVAVDVEGNLFIADTFNNRIRKVEASTGIITTIAGNGIGNFGRLWGPVGLAIDMSSNLLIADRENNCIRRIITHTGNITIVAGTGSQGFSGEGGPATSAIFDKPFGVAVDTSGNIYIADTNNHCIRQVDATTGNVTTVAGNRRGGFSGDGGLATNASLKFPYGIIVDSSGNLLISDTENNRIRRVDARTRIITTVAGNGRREFIGDGGLAKDASFKAPRGVVLDGSGSLFIADSSNKRIRKVNGPFT